MAATEERVLNTMRRMRAGDRPWVSAFELQRCTGLDLSEVRRCLAELHSAGAIEVADRASDDHGRVRLPTTPMSEDETGAQARSEQCVSSANVVSPFSMMAHVLTATPRERLINAAAAMSSGQMKRLPCLAVTTDSEDGQFERRRRELGEQIRRITGLDMTPAGEVNLLRRVQPLRPVGLDLDPVEAEDVHTAATRRDDQGRITSVTLPKGGNASPSTIARIEPQGEVLILHLDRRVNAKSITLTQEAASDLARRLDTQSAENAAFTPMFDGRTGMGGAMVVRSGDRQHVVSRDELHKHRIGATKPDQPVARTINLARGGVATLSEVEGVRPAGPVMMLQLDRRVNAQSIAIHCTHAASLRERLGSAMRAAAMRAN